MEDCKSYKMGDLFTLEYGKPVEDKDSIDGPIPVFGTNGQIGTSHLAPLCNHPSVILGRKGAYRGVHFSDRPFSVIDTAFYVEPTSDVFDIKWLYYKLLTYDINSMDSGSAIPSTDRYQIYSLSIDVPSLEVQKRTVRVLDSINDKIALNNRINHNLEEQAQALYKSWFVDFEPFKDGKFVESELGMIPEGWHVGALSEVAKITMGQSPSGASFNEDGNGILFYQGRTEFGFRYPSIKLFTTEPTRFSEPKSVLMSVRAPVGDINVSRNRCCIGRGLASIKPYTDSYSFLLYTMKSKAEDLDLYNGEGTVFGSINRKELEGLSVLIPSPGVVSAFNSLVTPFDSIIEVLSDEINNLQKQRDDLLPQLMIGKLTC